MYAVIEVGSKQYIVSKDDTLDVERLDCAKGKELKISNVLLVSKERKIEIGQPYVKGAHVQVVVIDDQAQADKRVSYKYRRRKNSHWKKGHRQKLTRIKIKDIATG